MRRLFMIDGSACWLPGGHGPNRGASSAECEAICRQHRAGCHNGTLPRMPSRDALKTLTPEHVETALSSFSMRRQAAALTLAERRAVAATSRALGRLTGRRSRSFQRARTAPLRRRPIRWRVRRGTASAVTSATLGSRRPRPRVCRPPWCRA